MKKVLSILSTLLLVATACNKEAGQAPDYSNVTVNLSVGMPVALTKSNFTLADPSDPIGGMSVTWSTDDRISIIVFQGDIDGWKSHYVSTYIELPDEADGLTSYDVSSLTTSLDLSSFDPSQNLKYVIVLSSGTLNDRWKNFRIWNGLPLMPLTTELTPQIYQWGMIAETEVQEVPFPSGTLTLSGSLHWITSVLAVQFDIASGADITYAAGSHLLMELKGPIQVNGYIPITKEVDQPFDYTERSVYFPSAGKLSETLDGNHCRYFTIPADDMTVNPDQKLAGSSISFYKRVGGTNTLSYTSTGSIGADVSIEAGKVYGIKIRVTDSDGDGNPEFTKF